MIKSQMIMTSVLRTFSLAGTHSCSLNYPLWWRKLPGCELPEWRESQWGLHGRNWGKHTANNHHRMKSSVQQPMRKWIFSITMWVWNGSDKIRYIFCQTIHLLQPWMTTTLDYCLVKNSSTFFIVSVGQNSGLNYILYEVISICF